jgi:hypothetical protein
MYKLNLVGMVVLSLGVAGGAAWLALKKSPAPHREQERIDFLVRSLGDRNPDVRRKAEAELRQMGPKAVVALQAAVDSSDKAVADRARKLLDELQPRETPQPVVDCKVEPKKDEPKIVEKPARTGVEIELVQPQAGIARFYVRMTNFDAQPYVVARKRVGARFTYGRYARFEILDSRGERILDVFEDPTPAEIELLAAAPGQTLDLFAGQGDGTAGVLRKLPKGEYRIRFVYDATAGYRQAAHGAKEGASLPSQEFASAFLTLRVD